MLTLVLNLLSISKQNFAGLMIFWVGRLGSYYFDILLWFAFKFFTCNSVHPVACYDFSVSLILAHLVFSISGRLAMASSLVRRLGRASHWIYARESVFAIPAFWKLVEWGSDQSVYSNCVTCSQRGQAKTGGIILQFNLQVDLVLS